MELNNLTVRPLDQLLERLRNLRKNYAALSAGANRYGAINCRKQHDEICWALGASRNEIVEGRFLGGITNVDI